MFFGSLRLQPFRHRVARAYRGVWHCNDLLNIKLNRVFLFYWQTRGSGAASQLPIPDPANDPQAQPDAPINGTDVPVRRFGTDEISSIMFAE
jgi:hypothetical protein